MKKHYMSLFWDSMLLLLLIFQQELLKDLFLLDGVQQGLNYLKMKKISILLVAEGLGAGPNGGEGFVSPEQGHYVGDIQLGSFQKVSMPSDAELAEYTKQTIDNTFIEMKYC